MYSNNRVGHVNKINRILGRRDHTSPTTNPPIKITPTQPVRYFSFVLGGFLFSDYQDGGVGGKRNCHGWLVNVQFTLSTIFPMIRRNIFSFIVS